MGFINNSNANAKNEVQVKVKEETEEEDKVEEDEDVEKRSNPQLPKLWRPQPSREYIANAADFSAMAILSRQYSLFGAMSPWKNNFLSSYGQLFNSALSSQVATEHFTGPQILPAANSVSAIHQNSATSARSFLQLQQHQQQQQHLRHHAKSLFG